MNEPPKTLLPPWALAIAFVDAVNTNNLDRLESLMHADHNLKLFDEEPVAGIASNVEAWRGYCGSWPGYIIYPRRMAEVADAVAILGHTTGSHLGLPDAEEARLTLIWLCRCKDGRVLSWELLEDTPDNRKRWSLD
jgi:hypothetical protein